MTPADAAARGAPLAPKIVNELRELHDRGESMAREGNRTPWPQGAVRSAGRCTKPRPICCASSASRATTSSSRTSGRAPEDASVDVSVIDLEQEARDETATLRRSPVRRRPSHRSRAVAGTAERRLPRECRGTRSRGARAEVIAVPSPTTRGSSAISWPISTRVAGFEEELAETRFELRTSATRSAPARPRRARRCRRRESRPCRMPRPAWRRSRSRCGHCVSCCAKSGPRWPRSARRRAPRPSRCSTDARLDAQRVRDAAAADARAVLDRARADAVALTRNAISTVDGLRQLAAEERDDAVTELA